MNLYVLVEDLYPHKLATIVGRGQRLKRILKAYPTERRFKTASLEEIGQVIGIKNLDSKIMSQLATLDKTYSDLITAKYNVNHSIAPEAKTIMGIDTEYLLSPLDSIQFVVLHNEIFFSGLIFTNDEITHSVAPKDGINLLRQIIKDFQPEIIVGHNFNCDISVLEKVYEDKIPELHNYDDTMKMARKSHVANIIGSAALKKLVHKLFAVEVVDVYTAYRDFTTFVEYGLMDAVFPILLRHFFMNGKKPNYTRPSQIDYMIHPKNNFELKYEKIHFIDD